MKIVNFGRNRSSEPDDNDIPTKVVGWGLLSFPGEKKQDREVMTRVRRRMQDLKELRKETKEKQMTEPRFTSTNNESIGGMIDDPNFEPAELERVGIKKLADVLSNEGDGGIWESLDEKNALIVAEALYRNGVRAQ